MSLYQNKIAPYLFHFCCSEYSDSDDLQFLALSVMKSICDLFSVENCDWDMVWCPNLVNVVKRNESETILPIMKLMVSESE